MAVVELPTFQNTARQQRWVGSELRTSLLIRRLWNAAPPKERHDGKFLALLVQCTWTNTRNDGSGRESTRRWRNRNLAEYLGVPYLSDEQLARALADRYPGLRRHTALALVQSETGITHYYKALRPETLLFIRDHATAFAKCFEIVSAKNLTPARRIAGVFDHLDKLGQITIRDQEVSPLNSTSPALACLDPRRRFPIMNARTASLLRAVGYSNDREGALELSKLIKKKIVGNAFELDVYALTENFSKFRPARKFHGRPEKFRDVGIKPELATLAKIVAKSVKVRRQHNELTNRLTEYLKWRHIVPKEHRFDGLIEHWKPGRHLLIEAKTSSTGSDGRTQVRQGIGQLFDYRLTHFANCKVDLAMLLPSRPAADVQRLLKTLKIECLWFEGCHLCGTIAL